MTTSIADHLATALSNAKIAHMQKQEQLEGYLALCKTIYERMERDGTWPWPDSQKSVDLVESEDNSMDL